MSLFRRMLVFSSLFTMALGLRAQTLTVENPIADMLDSLSSQKMFGMAFSKPVFPKNNKYKILLDKYDKLFSEDLKLI